MVEVKEQQEHLLKLVDIFKKEKGFHRLFSSFLQKYRIYGRLGNGISVSLTHPTDEEKRALSGLIGKDYEKNKSIRITVSALEKAIAKTQFGQYFEDISLYRILEAYEGRALVSKAEEQELFEKERTEYFQKWISEHESDQLFQHFIEWVQNEQHKGNRFLLLYKQNRFLLDTMLTYLQKVCRVFPLDEFTYMPIFSANITSNPHTFDLDREEGKLFISFLQILKQLRHEEELLFDTAIETTNALLYDFRLLRDDLLNSVTVFNLQATNTNERENFLLKGACEEQAMFHLPLKEIARLKTVRTLSRRNVLFMIENSVVSSYVANEIKKAGVQGSIIAGNGQLNFATLTLLDKFVKNGGIIQYAGDFDPEGLTIAQKLLNRYGQAVRLWKYQVGTYRKSLSDKVISEKSLAQLDSQLTTPELVEIAVEMKKRKKAGYQENVLNEFVEDIIEFYQS